MKQQRLIIAALALVLLGMLCFAYKDHFNNPFQFDDHHTIQSNMYIRSMKNIPQFFKDATTTSSLPANQAYRPGLTVLNTIDYALSGEKAEPKPFQFHLSIFINFILLGFLIYFFSLKVFNLSFTNNTLNPYAAFLVTAFYMLHTGNAETINYVIARSDSFSTFMIMLALCLFSYLKPPGRYIWYLIPLALGFFIKEPAVMIGPLALVYVLLFEEQFSIPDTFNKFSRTWAITKKIIPAFLLAIFLFAMAKAMTPKTWTSGNSEYFAYWLTQTFVIVHYTVNFLFPFNLSADTDWSLIKNPFDDRVIAGVLFIALLFFIAYRSSFKKETRPITFGILWFFICLAPTSIMPFAEVLNDHRVFLPYIGLTIALVAVLYNLYIRYQNSFFKSSTTRGMALMLIGAVLVAHMFGVRNRCQVWSSGETLWKDVTVKSPHNGRGLMNYGNAMMGKGDYNTALEYFNKAKQEWPYYSYIYTNLGVLYNALGNPDEAERNFKYAKQLNSQNPEFYYFYTVFLRDKGRFQEALTEVNTGLALSPQHPGLNTLKSNLISNPQYAASETDRVAMAEKQAKDNATPESWLNLSLVYYNTARYQDCVNAAQEALKLRPTYDLAYNNICSAYNMLHDWDKAIEAGKKAVELNPNNTLAKNNLKAAEDAKKNNP